MAEAKTVRSITGRQTTAGAPEESVLLTLDGAAPAATIAVGVDATLTITDWIVTTQAAANWRFQQTTDGVTWFDIALLRSASDGTIVVHVGTGLVVNGGTLVAVRIRVETPGGAAAVTTTVRGYTAP